jgi:diguanylate cyclase (GGDEF)-like protein
VLFAVLTVVTLPLRSSQNTGFVAFALVYVVGVVLGFGYSARAATHPRLDRALRRPWRYLSAVFVLDVVIGVSAMPIGRGTHPEQLRVTPLLIVGIVAVVVQAGFLVTGLLSFASLPWQVRVRRKLALDMIIVVGAASMILWYVLVWPTATGRGSPLSPAATLYDCSILLSDLASVVGISTVLLRGTPPSVRRPVRLVLASVVGFLSCDLWTIWGHLRGHPDVSGVISQLTVTVPLFLMVAAAVEQCRVAERPPTTEPAPPALRRPSPLPYLALAVGFGIQLIATVSYGGLAWFGLVLGGVVMTFGVAIRQFLTMRENYDLAMTDSLTGLANRDRQRATLDRAVDDGHRTGTSVAVLVIDLNGFKLVNDTYGHDTGDELLMAFAGLLRRALRTTDHPARWGGDEFVVVLTELAGTQDAISVAERILDETQHPVLVNGRRIQIQASIGIAVTDPGRTETTPEDLLHGADLAMYRAKHDARRTAHSGWQLHHPQRTDRDPMPIPPMRSVRPGESDRPPRPRRAGDPAPDDPARSPAMSPVGQGPAMPERQDEPQHHGQRGDPGAT